MYSYENFFNIYTDDNGTNFYNLLRNITVLPANNSGAEDIWQVETDETWLLISYRYYGTMQLWWLVCAYNGITNPTKNPTPGSTIKLLKSEFVWPVITALNQQINS